MNEKSKNLNPRTLIENINSIVELKKKDKNLKKNVKEKSKEISKKRKKLKKLNQRKY